MSQSTGLPKDVRAQLAEVRESLDGIEAELKPVLETPWETLVADLEPAQKAKLSLIVAYAADSLFYMYIKTQVINSKRGDLCRRRSLHGVIFEGMGRARARPITGSLVMQSVFCSLCDVLLADGSRCEHAAFSGIATEDHPVTEELARIKNYMKKLKDAAGEGEKQQARLKLNKEAASRFITAGLS
eukprot:2960424-Rhodomonas_salina.1